MDKIGGRLKKERERIGLNQTDMAAHGGVQLRAQVRYEKGERMPDAEYLAGVANAGIDILYVITGVRTGDPKLKPDEAALVDNYRNSPSEEQKALQTTSAAFAQRAKAGKVDKVA